MKYKEQSDNFKKKRIIHGQKKLDSFFTKIKKQNKITTQLLLHLISFFLQKKSRVDSYP